MPKDQNIRKKKTNNKKRTFELYGKNTPKGLRIKEAKILNQKKKK
jgi:hypothetical protein